MKTISSIITILIAALMAACSPDQPAATETLPSLPVAIVKAGTTEVQNEYPVTIEGEADVEIRPQVGGILEKIFVDEGKYVQKGQPLFKINDQVYREQVNNTSAELAAAQAAAANAQLEVDKLQPLVENKVVADLQLKTAVSNLKAAQSRVAQARAMLSDAGINLGYTLIKAPASGYIGRLNKKAGSLVSVSDAKELTSLSDIKDVRVYFSLSESEFAGLKAQLPGATIDDKLRNAKAVSLSLAGGELYPGTGKLDMVNGGFDKNSGAITIRATFANAGGLLRSGNTGRIHITFTQYDVISIPQSATTTIQDKIFVYTVGDSSKVHKQIVTVAGRTDNNFLIKGGLKQGDRIVLDGIDGLQEGIKIQAAAPKTEAVAYNN